MKALGLVLGLVMLSGCASLRANRTVQRVQSQVRLLDERVTQLERLSARAPATTAMIDQGLFSTKVEEPTLAVLPASPARLSAGPGRATIVHIGPELSPVAPTTRHIQQALQNAGFYQGAVDGKFGPLTREAIREFQRLNDLKVDGRVGSKTWGKLSLYADVSTAVETFESAQAVK